MKKALIAYAALISATPLVASAQFGGVSSYITAAGSLINRLTVIVAGIALLVFFWGLVKFIGKAGDEAALAEGRRLMIWGIIALFVMVSVWGLILFVQLQLNINAGLPYAVPTFPNP